MCWDSEWVRARSGEGDDATYNAISSKDLLAGIYVYAIRVCFACMFYVYACTRHDDRVPIHSSIPH